MSGQSQIDRITAVGDPDDLQSQKSELTREHLLQVTDYLRPAALEAAAQRTIPIPPTGLSHLPRSGALYGSLVMQSQGQADTLAWENCRMLLQPGAPCPIPADR